MHTSSRLPRVCGDLNAPIGTVIYRRPNASSEVWILPNVTGKNTKKLMRQLKTENCKIDGGVRRILEVAEVFKQSNRSRA